MYLHSSGRRQAISKINKWKIKYKIHAKCQGKNKPGGRLRNVGTLVKVVIQPGKFTGEMKSWFEFKR